MGCGRIGPQHPGAAEVAMAQRCRTDAGKQLRLTAGLHDALVHLAQKAVQPGEGLHPLLCLVAFRHVPADPHHHVLAGQSGGVALETAPSDRCLKQQLGARAFGPIQCGGDGVQDLGGLRRVDVLGHRSAQDHLAGRGQLAVRAVGSEVAALPVQQEGHLRQGPGQCVQARRMACESLQRLLPLCHVTLQQQDQACGQRGHQQQGQGGQLRLALQSQALLLVQRLLHLQRGLVQGHHGTPDRQGRSGRRLRQAVAHLGLQALQRLQVVPCGIGAALLHLLRQGDVLVPLEGVAQGQCQLPRSAQFGAQHVLADAAFAVAQLFGVQLGTLHPQRRLLHGLRLLQHRSLSRAPALVTPEDQADAHQRQQGDGGQDPPGRQRQARHQGVHGRRP